MPAFHLCRDNSVQLRESCAACQHPGPLDFKPMSFTLSDTEATNLREATREFVRLLRSAPGVRGAYDDDKTRTGRLGTT